MKTQAKVGSADKIVTYAVAASGRRVSSRGFSLIEVTIALGVVAVAFVGLFGLMPIGMQTFRSTIDTSVRSQIVQRVSADASQTDFDTLISSPPADRYFDDQGNEVPQANSIYQVRVQIVGSTALPSVASTGTNTNLATLVIQIANNSAHLADPYSNGSKISISEATTFVARNEHQ